MVQQLPVFVGTVLTTAVRVMQQALGRMFGRYCPDKKQIISCKIDIPYYSHVTISLKIVLSCVQCSKQDCISTIISSVIFFDSVGAFNASSPHSRLVSNCLISAPTSQGHWKFDVFSACIVGTVTGPFQIYHPAGLDSTKAYLLRMRPIARFNFSNLCS